MTHNLQTSQDIDELLNVLFQSTPDLVLFKDGEGRWAAASDYAKTLFGLENEQYVGKTSYELSQLTPIHEYRDVLSARWDADEKVWNAGKISRDEMELPFRNGRAVVLDVTSIPLFHADGSRKALVIMGQDLTKLKMAEKENDHLANYDKLTKLPNRFMFEQELEHQIVIANALQQKFALMVLDIDRFKYINDSLGLAAGDQLLIRISERLMQTCVENGWSLARAGDEFAIFIPNIQGVEHSIRSAQTILNTFVEPFAVHHYDLFMTTSIGLCLFPQDGENAQTLIKNANAALRLAKDQGRNRHMVFDSQMGTQNFKMFSLENSLNKAMAMSEFEVYYQPKIETATNRIVGAEALIRCNHPDWDSVSSSEFISLAEETGLIVPIEEWVKQTVCNQINEWKDSGIEAVPVSVNISAKHFTEKDFVSKVKRIIQENELDPSLLEIEITETSLMDEQIAIEAIQKLRAFGIKVSIDDFGTGYSALSYLRQFKVDAIKIDRSFIKDIGVNKQNERIVKGIIELIHSLEADVIAEGVETVEQLQFLRKHQCNQVQGYLYSKPVKADQFRTLLTRGQIEVNQQLKEQKREIDNRRKYYRIQFTYPLLAEMTIIKFMGKDISLGKAEVLIDNIGLGGLHFASNMKMVPKSDMVITVETEIFGQSMKFVGRIVWLNDLEDDIFHYGVEFLIDEDERDSIAKVLNSLSVKLRKNPILPDCRFIVTDIRRFFKEKRDERKS